MMACPQPYEYLTFVFIVVHVVSIAFNSSKKDRGFIGPWTAAMAVELASLCIYT